MNPVGGLLVVLAVLIIILGVKGTYPNIKQSLHKL